MTAPEKSHELMTTSGSIRCSTGRRWRSEPTGGDIRALVLLETLVGTSLLIVPLLLFAGLGSLADGFPRWPPRVGGVVPALAIVGIGIVIASYAFWKNHSRIVSVVLAVLIAGSACMVGTLVAILCTLVFNTGRQMVWILLLSGFGLALSASGIGLWRRSPWAPAFQRGISIATGIGLGCLALLSVYAAINTGWVSDRIIFLSFAGFCIFAGWASFMVARHFAATARTTELAFQGKATTARKIPKVKPGVVDVVGFRGAIGSLLVFWLFLTLIIAPNVVNAWQSSRQKKTMSSLRFVVTAVEAYAVDHGEFPEVATVEELVSLLTPDYVKTLPTVDGWGWPLEYYRVDNRGQVVRSPGSDGRFEHDDPTAYARQPVDRFEGDLVFSTVSGSQWPNGMMPP